MIAYIVKGGKYKGFKTVPNDYELQGEESDVNNNYENPEPIESLKVEKINELEVLVGEKLKKDFFDIDNMLGITALKTQYGQEIIQKTNEINALTTTQEVNDYIIKFD